MKVNLNDSVSVRLTPQGFAAWVRYRESVMVLFDPDQADERRKHFNMPDADGVLSEQLWVLFNVFGALMYNGGPNMFVDNVVDVGEESVLDRIAERHNASLEATK